MVRYVNQDDSEHLLVCQALRQLIVAGQTICIVPQVIYEFWSVCTRPIANNGLALSTNEAYLQVEILLDAFTLIPDASGLFVRWLDLCRTYEVCGRNTHDARIVANMLENQVNTLLTLNTTDFKRFDEINCLSPKTVTGE